MRSRSNIVVIVGILFIIIGIVVSALYFSNISSTPKTRADYTVNPPQTLKIEEGEYEIWYGPESEDIEPQVTIVDTDGNDINIGSQSLSSSSYNGATYYNVGKVNINKTGKYTFSSDPLVELYLTPPTAMAQGCGFCFLGIIMCVCGAIIVILGLVLNFRKKKAPTAPYQQYPGYPSQYPQRQPGPQYRQDRYWYHDNRRRYPPYR
jgi:uncharacterized membrane protein